MPHPIFSRHAFSGRPTQAVLWLLNWLAKHTLPPEKIAEHSRTGGLFSFAEAGVHDGGAKLPVAALPGRD